MKNTITVTIPFSFKGEQFTPSMQIDLDVFCQQGSSLDVLSHSIATSNNIGNYSYEYEVLQSSELHFSDATGIAKNHLVDTKFDLEGFRESFNEAQILVSLEAIANETMGIENLQDNEKLKNALIKAFHAGKES